MIKRRPLHCGASGQMSAIGTKRTWFFSIARSTDEKRKGPDESCGAEVEAKTWSEWNPKQEDGFSRQQNRSNQSGLEAFPECPPCGNGLYSVAWDSFPQYRLVNAAKIRRTVNRAATRSASILERYDGRHLRW